MKSERYGDVANGCKPCDLAGAALALIGLGFAVKGFRNNEKSKIAQKVMAKYANSPGFNLSMQQLMAYHIDQLSAMNAGTFKPWQA